MILIKEPILEVKNINLQYQTKQILRDVNLTIRNITREGVNQGQITSLIGRSGIGKTQLFKIISGLNQPTSGEVLIGSDLHPVVSGEVGIVSQNYILFNHRTILKNLDLAIKKNTTKHLEFGESSDLDIIRWYADKFDLLQHLDKYPHQLSGGQRQRASIVQQLLTGNKFILFDEPFSGLDCVMIEKVVQTLLKVSLQNEYNTLVIISHDLENSLAISDSVHVLAKQDQKEGATIVRSYDLIQMDLCYQENVRENSNFKSLIQEVKQLI